MRDSYLVSLWQILHLIYLDIQGCKNIDKSLWQMSHPKNMKIFKEVKILIRDIYLVSLWQILHLKYLDIQGCRNLIGAFGKYRIQKILKYSR